ncbi:MAG TPA: hypothetical protein PLC43_06250 [Caldisericia bacterium]|nr:hypothetical protein [Caldisericia bacterium]
MKNLRISNRRISKLLTLILLVTIILQACESTFSGTFIEVPESKFELIAELPSFDSPLPITCYGSWQFVKLKGNREGIAFIREVHGPLGGPCFLLGFYDIEKKAIVKDSFLSTSEELMYHPPVILVDNENKLYISLKDIIIVCDVELNILNILEPDLENYDLDYLTMSFIKDGKIFFLQDGKIFSIDINTGKIVDYINIDKEKYPELENLGTISIADYKDSSILIYYGDFPNGKENRKVILIYDIDENSVKNKFIFSGEHYLISGEIGKPYGFISCYPYIFIMLSNNSNINLFVYNIETKNEVILQFGKKFSVYSSSIDKIITRGTDITCYIWEHYSLDDDGVIKDAVYSLDLTEYLK